MRYQVPGVPTDKVHGFSAFMPNITRPAASGAQEYKGLVTGQPGTQAIPAPYPGVPYDTTAGALKGQSCSQDSPAAWWPQLWYERGLHERPGAGMPLRVYSDNQQPVPAVDPRGTPTLLTMPPPYATLANYTTQPQNLPAWALGVSP